MISRIRFVSQEIKDKVPFPHKLIDGHYSLILNNDKAMILTRNPLRTPRGYFVSHTTVEGDRKNQYLSGFSYKVEPTIMILEPAAKGPEFIAQNLPSLTKAYKANGCENLIKISELISNNAD